jgi:hypothetical protein
VSDLRPIECGSCGAPVPLPADLGERDETSCVHCGAPVAIGADHAAAVRAVAGAARARRDAEPLWRRLSSPPSAWVEWAGAGLMLALPPLATLLASLLPYPPLGRTEIYAAVTLPALVPGALIMLWHAAVGATVVRFRDAISAHPPRRSGAPPSCRRCGAPLAIEPGAIAATCGYCGTDSLVDEVPVRALQQKLRDAVRTLDDATRKLRLRKIALASGGIGIAAAIGGASLLLWLALGA